jgi:uncharacterized protein (DUF2235 family)
VSSVGWFSNPISLPYTANNADIAFGRHAIAIDERRAFFRTNLWRADDVHTSGQAASDGAIGPRDMKQVWFPGVHCDVGGGYAEEESGLSKITLKWMLEEAISVGLLTDRKKVDLILGESGKDYIRPNPDGLLHDSMTSGWKIIEYLAKPHWDGKQTTWRANKFKPRTWPAAPLVHDAAWLRAGGKYAERLPPDAIRLREHELNFGRGFDS